MLFIMWMWSIRFGYLTLKSSRSYFALHLVAVILSYYYLRPFEDNLYANVALSENELNTPAFEKLSSCQFLYSVNGYI